MPTMHRQLPAWKGRSRGYGGFLELRKTDCKASEPLIKQICNSD